MRRGERRASNADRIARVRRTPRRSAGATGKVATTDRPTERKPRGRSETSYPVNGPRGNGPRVRHGISSCARVRFNRQYNIHVDNGAVLSLSSRPVPAVSS